MLRIHYMHFCYLRMSTPNVSMGPPAPQPPLAGAMGPPQAPVAAPAAGAAPAAAAPAQDPPIGPVVNFKIKLPLELSH